MYVVVLSVLRVRCAVCELLGCRNWNGQKDRYYLSRGAHSAPAPITYACSTTSHHDDPSIRQRYSGWPHSQRSTPTLSALALMTMAVAINAATSLRLIPPQLIASICNKTPLRLLNMSTPQHQNVRCLTHPRQAHDFFLLTTVNISSTSTRHCSSLGSENASTTFFMAPRPPFSFP